MFIYLENKKINLKNIGYKAHPIYSMCQSSNISHEELSKAFAFMFLLWTGSSLFLNYVVSVISIPFESKLIYLLAIQYFFQKYAEVHYY